MAVVTRCLDHQWNHDACCKQQAIISTFVASTEASHRAFNLTASQGDKEISYNMPFSSETNPISTCSTSHNVLVIVASLHVLCNTLLVLEEGSFFFPPPPFSVSLSFFFLILALQFDKARPDLLANLQHACHKLAANLINLITNMVFLKITSQSGFTSPAADSTYSVLWRICSFSEKGQNVKISKTSLFLLSSCSNVVVPTLRLTSSVVLLPHANCRRVYFTIQFTSL